MLAAGKARAGSGDPYLSVNGRRGRRFPAKSEKRLNKKRETNGYGREYRQRLRRADRRMSASRRFSSPSLRRFNRAYTIEQRRQAPRLTAFSFARPSTLRK
jgi:hypothetical protein